MTFTVLPFEEKAYLVIDNEVFIGKIFELNITYLHQIYGIELLFLFYHAQYVLIFEIFYET